jgi:hypothetical protein
VTIEELIAFHEDKLKRYRAEGFTTEFTEETLKILKRVQICQEHNSEASRIKIINYCDGCK